MYTHTWISMYIYLKMLMHRCIYGCILTERECMSAPVEIRVIYKYYLIRTPVGQKELNFEAVFMLAQMSKISTIHISTTNVESHSFFPHGKTKSFC